MGGYKFLMQNYREGDRICLFGFSRGAYTARCLAGMLHKVGLLPASNIEQVPFAYNMYKRNTTEGWKQSASFKKTFSRAVMIEFVGCWVPTLLPFWCTTLTSLLGHGVFRRRHLASSPSFQLRQHHHQDIPTCPIARRTSCSVPTQPMASRSRR